MSDKHICGVMIAISQIDILYTLLWSSARGHLPGARVTPTTMDRSCFLEFDWLIAFQEI